MNNKLALSLFLRIVFQRMVPGRFAPNPVRPLSRYAPIPVRPGSFRPDLLINPKN